MDCLWIKSSPGLSKGITIVNQLDESRFEQFLRRIVSKMKLHDTEIFNGDEVKKLEKIFQIDEDSLLLAIKTLVFIFKKLLKFIHMPANLKNDLKSIGFIDERADIIVQRWSAETKSTLDELGSESIEKLNDYLDCSWILNAELSSVNCKKTKVPKVYLTLSRSKEETEIEVSHPELYSMYLQFEAIQHELNNLGI